MIAPGRSPTREPSPRPRGTPGRLRWLLWGLVLAGCGAEPERVRPEHRLLIVGWDGATWETIDPLLAAGRLPNLARMIGFGSTARLASTVIPISSAAWVGAASGRSPGHTGVYGFFEPIEDSYNVALISSRSNRATPIWRTLGRRGLRSIVLGVPVTHPPEPIAGTMVTGMLAPADSEYTWPPALAARLRADGFLPDLGIWRQASNVSGPILERQFDAKRRALDRLMDEEDWDLTFAVYKELDVVSHFAYDGRLDGIVAAVYERLDQELGHLLAKVGADTRVLLVSDHGFHAYPASFYSHAWLLESGHCVQRADAPAPPELGNLPLAQRRALESGLQMASLDMARTRAFAGEAEGNFGTVRLNLAGREPEGVVQPDEAEAVLAEIERDLRALETPDGGRPLVTRVWRRGELYPGPHAERLPDLFFETDPAVAVRAIAHTKVFEVHPEPPFPDHKREGVLVAAGPGAASFAERGDASILDVGPTALHLLGQCVYREREGRVLTELFPGLPAPCEVAEESERPRAGERAWLEDTSWSDADVEEVSERLGQLGYVDRE